MVLLLLKIFVSVSILVACVNSQAESAGDPRSHSTTIGTPSPDAGQGSCFYQSQVFFNPESICNCTTIRALVSAELEDTKHQLKQLFGALQSLGEILKKDLDNSTLRDCSEAPVSGVYRIQPDSDDPSFKVYCDMETDGGGWMVFQRRQDGFVDFYKSFNEYSQGFGYLEGEFWLGNKILHLLTAHNKYELRVDIADFEGNSVYAVYDSFRVGELADNYALSVGGYSGTAGDSLSYHNGMSFTTKDRDNDVAAGNCAEMYHSAWWHRSCFQCDLNGKYLHGEVTGSRVAWNGWKKDYSMKTSEMKIRMKN